MLTRFVSQVEDDQYGPFPGNTKRFFKQSLVNNLIAAARVGLKEWFKDLLVRPATLASSSSRSLCPLAPSSSSSSCAS